MTNLLETFGIVIDAFNRGKTADLALLEFVRAFDKVSEDLSL